VEWTPQHKRPFLSRCLLTHMCIATAFSLNLLA